MDLGSTVNVDQSTFKVSWTTGIGTIGANDDKFDTGEWVDFLHFSFTLMLFMTP
jgi:hypothetical protein